ncbi:MAG TPA: hypothetical protein ENK75_02895 [Saprospiraceae bacterium]|nr:hypothetical protein [Saprospiraceae bacterium]
MPDIKDTPPIVEEVIPEETATFPVLHFEQSNHSLRSQDKQALETVINALNTQPELSIILSIYAQALGDKSQALSTAIQKGELVSAHLQEHGIAPEQITMRALTVPALDTAPFLLDFAVANTAMDTPLPVIGKTYNPAATGSSMNQGLLYQLQISSSKKAVALNWLDQYDNPMIEKRASLPYYRYSIGGTSTFKEARTLKSKLAKAGKKDAFIVPYLYGSRANKKIAKKFANQFPDLKNYLGM